MTLQVVGVPGLPRIAPGDDLAALIAEASAHVAWPDGTRGLADGGRIEAAQAVLALGPLQGGDPIPVPEELREDGVYIGDPWAPGALEPIAPEEKVLVIGTGLIVQIVLGF